MAGVKDLNILPGYFSFLSLFFETQHNGLCLDLAHVPEPMIGDRQPYDFKYWQKKKKKWGQL